jgi:hypothetical protein
MVRYVYDMWHAQIFKVIHAQKMACFAAEIKSTLAQQSLPIFH